MNSSLLLHSAVLVAMVGLSACSGPPDAGDDGLDDMNASAVDVGRDGAPVDAARDTGVDAPDVAGIANDAGRDASSDVDVHVGPDLGDCVPEASDLPYLTEMPSTLSQTGLYADFASRTLSAGVEVFVPRFQLWSDGAAKQRFVYLPSCPKIDNADPDHWSMPVGARFWKHFEVDGVLLETRFFYRFGNGPDEFYFGAYVWTEEGSDPTLTISGVPDARGTNHDIPSIHGCEGCHLRVPERILGFSAIQLDHDDAGVTLTSLAERLTTPVAPIALPGDAATQEALGYLHANCGNCHNDTEHAVLLQSQPLDLRIAVADRTLADTGVSRTAIGVPVDRFSHPTCSTRIVAGSSETSCLVLRMDLRGPTEQMPPVGSEIPDPDAIAAVSTWIDGL